MAQGLRYSALIGIIWTSLAGGIAMKPRSIVPLLVVWVLSISAAPAQEKKEAPLRIFIRAGAKTHGPGEHDHPAFLKDWTELLRARGAVVDGALEFPSAGQLEKTDVLVMFAAEAGTIAPEDRANLDAFTKRGGGLVAIHDAVCGKDPQWFKTVIGGAWEHGKSKYLNGTLGIYVQDYPHEITRGISNFMMDDEIYWDLHLMPEAKVLGTAFRTPHEITPQMWIYEKENYRAFVNIQGHKYSSFSLPHYRAILLRGIAWAGKRAVDSLVSQEELASLSYPVGGPTRPSESREKITIEKDFELSLVLAEPDVVKPVSMAWDPKGRLWVAQTPQYPNRAVTWQTKPYDSIVYYENGKKKVFYDQLDLVTSFVFYKDGVIAQQAGELVWLRDTDGDGVADTRVPLYSGFGYGDTHAVASNLRWGLDGWIYATQGYSGGGSNHLTNAKGVDFGKIPNGIFRFKPDGSAIESVCAYGGNTWGMDFAWDGELFFTMANESHVRHVVVPDAVLAKGRFAKTESWKQINDHRDSNPILKHTLQPYVQIDCVGGFTAASGSTLYDGGAWPAEYRNIHFVCECTVNLVHQDRLIPDGVTWKATKVRAEEIVAGSDLWFRPIDTQIAPDGSLYIADFYNQAVVHNDTRGPKHGPFNAAVRPDRDHEHGRIWRLQHKDPAPMATPDFASLPGLIKALEHPNRWARLTAQRLLVERGEGSAELSSLLKTTPKPETKVLALWTLERLGAIGEAELLAALNDADAGVRKNAARVAGVLAKGEMLRSTLLAKLDDADPRTRLEKIIALGAFPGSPNAAGALIALSARLEDPWSKSAVLGALASSPLDSMLAAIDANDPSLVEDLASILGNRQDPALASLALQRIAAKPAAANPLKKTILVNLSRTLKPELAPEMTPELRHALEALLAAGDEAIVSAVLPFAARWVKDGSMAKALEPVTSAMLATVSDASKPDAARLLALSSLLTFPALRSDAIKSGSGLLQPSLSADFQRGVILTLGETSDTAAAAALVGAYPRLSAALRDLVVSQVFKRPSWTAFLIDELDARRIKPNDLGVSAIFRLRTHPDKAVAKKASEVLDGILGTQNKAKDAIIEALYPAVSKQGDAARGKQHFTETCLKCHGYKGEGRSIAPDLTGMGVHGKHELLISIIDPNRSVETNYVSFNVRLKNGEVFNGLLAKETRDMVLLKNNEGDREIRRSDIDAMVSTGLSLMPEGLESLGADVLRDILTFLVSEAGNFRVVDLQTAFTASNVKGLYDPQREPNNLRLKKYGILTVDGIPFQVMDPAKSLNGNNAIVLKGGSNPDWYCKTSLPQAVEVPMGFACDKLHVLGGIAAWGTLEAKKGRALVKVTYHYSDGKTETQQLFDGVEFSDWIKRVDVPGSKFVDGLLEPGRGQLRWFTLKPGRRDAIHHLSLESYDNNMAPTFLAITAEVGGGAEKGSAPAAAPQDTAKLEIPSSRILVVGGGSSHDFERWFHKADAGLLGAAYTSNPAQIAAALPELQVLALSNNQPIADPAARKGIFELVEAGKGLVLVHPACWYNWKDWPEYNRQLVGGGARGHEKYQEFEVTLCDETSPILAGVSRTFRVKDELYQFAKDPEGPEIQVLAKGKSLDTGKEYPVVWTVKHPKGRIVCITLGHDAAAHEHEAYKKLLQNAAAWAAMK
jgi:putative membrane-bound dehydrogenase-like protein